VDSRDTAASEGVLQSLPGRLCTTLRRIWHGEGRRSPEKLDPPREEQSSRKRRERERRKINPPRAFCVFYRRRGKTVFLQVLFYIFNPRTFQYFQKKT
ncbi:hypothetical protein QML37_30790, partial [Klebsiella pneumoniae]|uniref:hypothetical protein n=1 Tax=Klebsiella pneumoniae TaxID=573 RepID=UPI003A812E05